MQTSTVASFSTMYDRFPANSSLWLRFKCHEYALRCGAPDPRKHPHATPRPRLNPPSTVMTSSRHHRAHLIPFPSFVGLDRTAPLRASPWTLAPGRRTPLPLCDRTAPAGSSLSSLGLNIRSASPHPPPPPLLPTSTHCHSYHHRRHLVRTSRRRVAPHPPLKKSPVLLVSLMPGSRVDMQPFQGKAVTSRIIPHSRHHIMSLVSHRLDRKLASNLPSNDSPFSGKELVLRTAAGVTNVSVRILEQHTLHKPG